MKRLIPLLAAGLLLALATGQDAQAQLGVDFGPEASYNTDTEDFGVGARLQISPIAVPIGLIAHGQYIFCDQSDDIPDVTCSGFEFGASGKYTIGLPGFPIGPYVGGGLTYRRASLSFPGEDQALTDSGPHLMGGVELGGLFPIGAFLEGRYAFLEQNQLTIGAGILF